MVISSDNIQYIGSWWEWNE